MELNTINIIISGGGTMGHISPALALINEFKKNNETNFYYFGSKKGLEKKVITNAQFIELDIMGIDRKNIFKNILVFFKLYRSYRYARKMVKKIKPDLIIGTGGYVSSAVCLAGIKLKYKTIIHEQNSIPGLTNKFLGKKCHIVCGSFPYTKKFFSNNFVLTGNPATQEFTNRINNYIPNKGYRKRILFVGGSLGADRLNKEIKRIVHKLADYDVTWITGKEYYDLYKHLENSNIKILPFTNELCPLMVEADLIVSRAGATTIFEVIALGKPLILIPSPNVSNNHQYINASIIYDEKGCELLLEENIEDLYKKLTDLMNNQFKMETMVINQRNMHMKNPAKRIYDLAMKLMG